MRRITSLEDLDDFGRSEAARILVEALAHVPSAWPDLPAALEEVATFLENSDRLAFAGLEQGEVRGWIGAIRHSEFGWEMHPLVIDPPHQRVGWGRQLVAALESRARTEGAITLWLGTDDDFGGTNLYGQDLYPDVLGKLRAIAPAAGHPFTFYERLGYTVTGVLPDVDGVGKHDILMAKRLAP